MESFWLPGVDNPAFKNFIKYNNHEDWGDNWDKKLENKNYTKVDFPDIVVNNSETPWTTATTAKTPDTPATGRETVENLNSQDLKIDWVWYMDDGEFKFKWDVLQYDDKLKNHFINYWENKYYELDQNDNLVSDWLYYTLIKESWADLTWIVLWKIDWNSRYVWNVTVMNGNYKYEWTVDGLYTKLATWKMTFPNWNTFVWDFDWKNNPKEWIIQIGDKKYKVGQKNDRLIIKDWEDEGKYIDMKLRKILNS